MQGVSYVHICIDCLNACVIKINRTFFVTLTDYRKLVTAYICNVDRNKLGKTHTAVQKQCYYTIIPQSIFAVNAFKNCASLTTINLEVVEFIREGAFYGCAALEDITFAEGVTIEDWAFSKTPYASFNP